MTPFRETRLWDIMKMLRQYRLQRPAMRMEGGNEKRLLATTSHVVDEGADDVGTTETDGIEEGISHNLR